MAPFTSRHTRADVELLAEVDEAHDMLNGPATRRIFERELHECGKRDYERLAGVSAAHLYNLRIQGRYREHRLHDSKTRPTTVNIGERRKPQPDGRPGYLRVDSVHQGNPDGVKGVYHINAVDEVTQWQIMVSGLPVGVGCAIMGCKAQISEAGRLSILANTRSVSFQIRGFHSDNGSEHEHINQTVARLLNKLLIEQTKSRPQRSNDNGLIETKNGAVIRKNMGSGHIAAAHAEAISCFYREYLNPCVHLHRPCAQADVETDEKGRKRRHYRRYQTPLETLLAMPEQATFPRLGQSIEPLRCQAARQSQTTAARQMQAAKQKLFAGFRNGA